MTAKERVISLMKYKQRTLNEFKKNGSIKKDIDYFSKEDEILLKKVKEEQCLEFLKALKNNRQAPLFYHATCIFCFINDSCEKCAYGIAKGRCGVEDRSPWRKIPGAIRSIVIRDTMFKRLTGDVE